MTPPRTTPAPSVRAFIAGNSGSGKTTLAHRLYLQRYPRVIVLDLTGEWEGKVDAIAYDVPELVQRIRNIARTRGKWTVALSLSPAEMPSLVRWLIPVPNVKASPILAVGGAAILVDEVDLLAPPGTAKEDVRTLYRRSRHVGLSVISTTQRPANVSREVSAQSTHAIALTLHEASDIDYVSRLMRWDSAAVARWRRWTMRHPHGGQWLNLQTGESLWIQETGAMVIQARPTVHAARLGPSDDSEDDDSEEEEEKKEEPAT